MAITPLPPIPSRTDTPANFSAKADVFLGALPQLQSEINTDLSTIASLKQRQSINLLINGGFDVWQRGTSFTNVLNVTSYKPDRWKVQSSNPLGTINKQSQANGIFSGEALRFTAGEAGAYLQVGQDLEFTDVRRLRGKVVTLSCAIRGTGTNPGAGIRIRQTVGGSINNAIAFTGAGSVTNYVGFTSWTKVSHTVLIDPSATNISLEIQFGSYVLNDIFEVSQVQLEEGSVATDFEYRSYSEELALCQRYYREIRLNAYNPLLMTGGADLVATSSHILFGTIMRVAPSFSVSPSEATHRIAKVTDNTVQAANQILSAYTSGDGYRLRVPNAINGGDYIHKNYSSNATDLVFDAEIY